MKIEKLLDGVEISEIIGKLPESADDITDDSRKTVKNGLFFCVEGNNKDGYDFLGEALKNGAVVAVGEKKVETFVCLVIVKDVKKAMSVICSNFYGAPQEKMKIFGVVGTNGKTSVCHILSRIFENAGYKTATIGTLGVSYNKTTEETGLTSPGTVKLYQTLDKLGNAGVTCVFMEVSAHAIDQRRCEGLYFECLIFTNCTRDHLDYFGTMENYFETKKSFFMHGQVLNAALNADDETSDNIIKDIKVPYLTLGISSDADVFARDIEISEDGVSFSILLRGLEEMPVHMHLTGMFNVYNALAAASLAMILGIDQQAIREGLESVVNVPGRVEMLDTKTPYKVILDYSHSPDALENILTTVRTFTRSRLIVLFGCGGDRDHGKRPIMGEIAGRLADFSILTSDNPRTEDPNAILASIEEGIKPTGGKFVIIENRRDAIRHALEMGRDGDVIILAGKGHETYQDIMGVKRPFDEKVVVQELLRELQPESESSEE